jgi:hypothetical protein
MSDWINRKIGEIGRVWRRVLAVFSPVVPARASRVIMPTDFAIYLRYAPTRT